jgi:HEPN domain-containing protein
MKEATNAWFLSAESDLLLIQKIQKVESLTHLSAFHAQQAVEKSFKALIEEFELGFVRTHSLEMLYNKVKDKISIEININTLIILDQLYIDARYMGEYGLLPNGKPSVSETKDFFNFAEEVFAAARSICKQ